MASVLDYGTCIVMYVCQGQVKKNLNCYVMIQARLPTTSDLSEILISKCHTYQCLAMETQARVPKRSFIHLLDVK